MKWTSGDRGNIEDLRGQLWRMRAMPLGIGGVLVLLIAQLGDGR